MKKVLFANSYFYPMDKKQWNNKTPYPPLGTLYALSLLRNNDFQVSFFDVSLKDNVDEIQTIISKENPDILVIYDDGFNYLTKMCLTTMRMAAFEMIKIAKKKGLQVIVSSSDSTDHYEKYLNAGSDFVIYGEAENTLLELIRSLFDNRQDFENIDGIYFKKDNKIEKTRPREVIKDLDQLPMPAWDLVDINSYKKIWKKGKHRFTMNIATTRGCPFHCNWCAKPIYGQRYNSHSPERVVEMIEYLQKNYNVERFWMSDDIFGLKPGWVQRFRDIVKAKRLKFNYYIQSRADLLLKDDTIEALYESGLEEVWIGAESGSQRILDEMDKGISVEQIILATEKLKAYNIKVAWFIQYGYLGETKEDIQMTLDLIKKYVPDSIGVSVSYPLPGTIFYRKVQSQLGKKKNWKDSDDLAMLFKGTFNQEFYRKLQRYTHKILSIEHGKKSMRKILKNPFNTKSYDVFNVIKMLVYIPVSIMDKITLSKLENIK